jgi:hypothetical protein
MATPINLPSIYRGIAAPQGANPADVQSAKDQLAMEFAPQEAGIGTTIQQIQQFLDQDVAAQQQYGNIADQKISDIGNQLAGQLTQNVGAIGNIYQAGQERVGGIYDEATKSVQGAGQSIRDRIAGSAASLGQTQALKADPYGADPISRLLAQQASAETRLATGKAGSKANLNELGTQLQGIAQKAVGDSEKEYAQKRTDVANQVLKTISNLKITGQKGIMEQLQKYSVLAEIAGPTFRNLLNNAASARTKAEREAWKDNLDAMAKMAQIQKDQAESDPNSLDNQLKRLNIADKEFTLGEKVGGKNYLGDLEGNNRLMEWLNANVRADRKSVGLSGTEHAGIQNFINQNLPNVSMSGMYNTTDPVKILMSLAQQSVDPKSGKVNLPISPGSKYTNRGKGDYQTDLQTLLEALTARFQNVGTSAKAGTRIK